MSKLDDYLEESDPIHDRGCAFGKQFDKGCVCGSEAARDEARAELAALRGKLARAERLAEACDSAKFGHWAHCDERECECGFAKMRLALAEFRSDAT